MLSTGLSAEVAELFCDAQEPTLARIRSRSWRGHGGSADKVEAMSDEELLASAWSELPGEMLWSPVDRSHRHKQNGPLSSICEATVRRLAEAGATQREIAAEVGMAQSTVMNFMSKRGIQVNRRKGVPLDTLTPSRLEPLCLDEAEMVAQYKNGWSLKQVALEHRCSGGTVRAVLHRNGVKCRTLAEAQRGRGAFGRTRVRLDDEKVAELRRKRATGESWKSLGEHYGIHWAAARCAGLGLTWSHVATPDVSADELKRRFKRERAAREVAARREKVSPRDGKIVELHASGLSKRRIEAELGVSFRTVRRALKRAGIGSVSKRANEQSIIAMRLAGASTPKIAATLCVARGTVEKVLKLAGVGALATSTAKHESAIVAMYADGISKRQIAATLHVSINTVLGVLKRSVCSNEATRVA